MTSAGNFPIILHKPFTCISMLHLDQTHTTGSSFNTGAVQTSPSAENASKTNTCVLYIHTYIDIPQCIALLSTPFSFVSIHLMVLNAEQFYEEIFPLITLIKPLCLESFTHAEYIQQMNITMYISTFKSIQPSKQLFIHLYLSINPFIHLYFNLSTHLFIC